MTEEEIKQYAHEYAEKQIKHKMAIHDIFNKEQATEEIEQAFIEGTDFMYYSNNEELKKELTEKDKQIEELKAKSTRQSKNYKNDVEVLLRKIANLEAQIEKMEWHDLRVDPQNLPKPRELSDGSWYTELVLCFEYREDDHGKKAMVYGLDRFGPEPYKWEENKHGWDTWCELPAPPKEKA